jgi:hypothetical protein
MLKRATEFWGAKKKFPHIELVYDMQTPVGVNQGE